MLRKRRPRASLAGEQAADPAAALTAAVGWLSRRDFCSAELAGRLAARGFTGEVVRSALAELIERRYIDDERYAHQFVAMHAGRGHGPLRIQRDLVELGLAAALVEAALGGFAEEQGDWARLAHQVRIRRFGPDAPESWPERARQARFLQYRGFSNDHIRSALGNDALGDAD